MDLESIIQELLHSYVCYIQNLNCYTHERKIIILQLMMDYLPWHVRTITTET